MREILTILVYIPVSLLNCFIQELSTDFASHKASVTQKGPGFSLSNDLIAFTRQEQRAKMNTDVLNAPGVEPGFLLCRLATKKHSWRLHVQLIPSGGWQDYRLCRERPTVRPRVFVWDRLFDSLECV
ncbi:hypothetical protein BDV96DRAFT_588391 [Lophiotrema nucula]|uniref:Uncharacterized protein n=1 Tax=Lophiotrema nucula TaxID=690887 RepID=A0A6A5YNZ6_9PLEO|nr:hypothetical protein BDV96DRAFT_588391 [Lophiotrema nucula]